MIKYLPILFLFGCVTEKKVNNYVAKHPEYIAGKCADNFPLDTIVNVYWDTVNTYKVDTLIKTDTLSKKETTFIYNTKVQKVDRIVDRVVENKARVTYLQLIKTRDSINYLVKDAENKKEISIKANRIIDLKAFNWLLIILIGILLILLFRKPLKALI
jgi:hypothetical protein